MTQLLFIGLLLGTLLYATLSAVSTNGTDLRL